MPLLLGRIWLGLLLLLAWPQMAPAQSVPSAGYTPRLVTVLQPVPMPPGGLWPYRQGQLWGYADTTGRVVVAPQDWEQLAVPPPFWGEYAWISLRFHSRQLSWLPAATVPVKELWVNARGEFLLVREDEIAIRQPDGSVRAVRGRGPAPAAGARFQPPRPAAAQPRAGGSVRGRPGQLAGAE